MTLHQYQCCMAIKMMAEGLELIMRVCQTCYYYPFRHNIHFVRGPWKEGKSLPNFLWVVHVPDQKIVRIIFAFQFFLWGFSWQAVRRLLKSDKVTEARCDQHNTKQEKSPDQVLALLREKKINAKVGVYQGSLSLPRGWWQKFAYKDGICLQLNTFIEQLRFTDKRIWSFPLDIWEEI